MKLYHPNPNEHHRRLAALLKHAWNTPVVFDSDAVAQQWNDSGWLNAPSVSEPDSSDKAAWIYWRTWMWEQTLTIDTHGRPNGSASVRDLRLPEAELLTRQWGTELGCSLEPVDRPAPILVVDIDHMFAYRGRGLVSALGGWFLDAFSGRWSALRARVHGPDPFNSHGFWCDLSQRFPQLELQFFALLAARKGQYDRGVKHSSLRVRELLKDLALRFEVGAHLSYASHDLPNGYRIELAFLEGILERPVLRQRSHFLRNSGQDEFIGHLESLGVTEDWSLEFADVAGFRAGWASGVPLGGVLQLPVAAMDQNFLGKSPRAIADELHRLQAAAWSVGAPLRVGTHWRIFGPHPEVERSTKDFSSWRSGLDLWLSEWSAK